LHGLQLDLEPISEPLLPALTAFLTALREALVSPHTGCVSGAHPAGRRLAAFGGAAHAGPLLSALGDSGIFVLSGYDLGPGPPGTASSPQAYAAALGAALDATLAAAVGGGHFTVGLPAAASTTEYEAYVDGSSGAVTPGHPQTDYLRAAVDVLRSRNLPGSGGFVGAALWGHGCRRSLSLTGARATSNRRRPSQTPLPAAPAQPTQARSHRTARVPSSKGCCAA